MRHQKGSLLIVTLWVLSMLALFTLAVSAQARQRLRFIQQFEIRSQLRSAADSGILRARQAVFKSKRQQAHSLADSWAYDEGIFKDRMLGNTFFTVRSRSSQDGSLGYGAVDEARKIDLNKTKSAQVIAGIFEYGAGVSRSQASEIADALLDWRDEDDSVNAGGAESRYYRTLSPPYECKNKDLDTLEELLLIKGITPEILLRVQPYVTVDGEETVNLNTAPGPVLRAMGLSPALTEKILLFRAGRDRKERTKDDLIFRNPANLGEDLKQIVPLSAEEKTALDDFGASGKFGVSSHMFSAVSTGFLQGRKEALSVECFFSLDGRLRRCREVYHRLDEESGWPWPISKNKSEEIT
ncbi:MAG: general secretion pathway protein GspK [Candidatus Omnitrophica bacterium]|nr:general secretion pathway protein GspK [Candidatus Omnitrophota bacterium]